MPEDTAESLTTKPQAATGIKTKDVWDKWLIVAQIFGAVLVPVILLFISSRINSIDKTLEFQKHDLAILQEFNKSYFHDEKRSSIEELKLAFTYIDLVKDPKARFNLREFFMWDTLFSIVIKPENKGKKYKYDPDNRMWGTFAWNLMKMKKEYKKEAEYEKYLKQVVEEYAPLQIGEYASKKEITTIFNPPAFR